MNRTTTILLLSTLSLAACSDASDPTPASPEPKVDAPAAGAPADAGGGGQADAPARSAEEHVVVVVGTPFTADMAAMQERHDQVASGGEAQAKAAGDAGHKVMLGTTLLGTTENQFLAIDRWPDPTHMDAVYGNPDFAKALGSLFAAPPTVGTYVKRSTWKSWGAFDSATADPHYFVVVRGTLAESDPAKAQAAHDAVAGAGEAQAKAAGDLAHLVFTGRDDARQFLAIDAWNDSGPIEAFYGDPQFQAAFASLFAAPPTIGVYESTDWHQW
mgnify:CR=1 FL=1